MAFCGLQIRCRDLRATQVHDHRRPGWPFALSHALLLASTLPGRSSWANIHPRARRPRDRTPGSDPPSHGPSAVAGRPVINHQGGANEATVAQDLLVLRAGRPRSGPPGTRIGANEANSPADLVVGGGWWIRMTMPVRVHGCFSRAFVSEDDSRPSWGAEGRRFQPRSRRGPRPIRPATRHPRPEGQKPAVRRREAPIRVARPWEPVGPALTAVPPPRPGRLCRPRPPRAARPRG
jgi:hypothetical protein